MKNLKCKANLLANRNRWIAILVAVVFALPVLAEWNTQTVSTKVTLPKNVFHSTSTMQATGSVHSYKPANLNAEGRATYFDTTNDDDAEMMMYGPRRIGGYKPTTDPMPIGDGVLPLLLFAAAFGGGIYLRQRRAQISPTDLTDLTD